MAYVGLEIATLLVPLNNIQQYWENKKFSGHQDLKDVMLWNEFQTIWGETKFHLPEYLTLVVVLHILVYCNYNI